jgi:hypothetical protein
MALRIHLSLVFAPVAIVLVTFLEGGREHRRRAAKRAERQCSHGSYPIGETARSADVRRIGSSPPDGRRLAY